METFTDLQSLPDGQSALWRTRIGYGGVAAIRRAIDQQATDSVFYDAVMRAFLIKATVKDYETGETLTDVGPDKIDRGDPDVVDAMVVHAMVLYVAWKTKADPKAAAATEPESDESETSAAS